MTTVDKVTKFIFDFNGRTIAPEQNIGLEINDSLEYLEIIHAIEDEFNITVDVVDAMSFTPIEIARIIDGPINSN